MLFALFTTYLILLFFPLCFVSEAEKLYDMSTSASGSAPKRGRPSHDAEAKRIRLKPEVFDLWMQKKENLGYLDKSHCQFAEFLLGLCAKENAGQHSSPKISPSDSTG